MSYLIFNICLLLFIGLSLLSYYLIFKVEHLEDKLDEKQSLINASRRNLADAENRISQRNDLLEYQQNKIKKLKDKLTVLEAYITSNNYGNAEIRLQKLKELVSDCESNNQF